MPTIEQIRAARALIGWSQGELAQESGLSQTGIARIENGTNQPNSSTIGKITSAFDRADVEFIGETGVKKRVGEVRTLRGADGFRAFMDDVFETVRHQGGEICVFNVDEKNWIKWMGQENYDRHAQRMKSIDTPYNFKIIVEENDWFFIANEVAEYRWFPKELFDKQSFYAYGNKLAFLNFTDSDVQVMILEQSKFSDGFRVLFNVAWNNVAKIPKK